MPISDPRDISGLVLWYSAEAETAYSNGASMTGWTDLSGNGNHATAQGTLAPQWESATGKNGGAAVRFRGTHGTTSATWGYFSLPASVMGSAAAGEIHASVKSDGQNCSLWGLGMSSGTAAASHYPFDSAIYEGFGTNSRKTVGFPEVAITDWRRYNVWSAAGDWAARIDAFTEFSTASNTVLWDSAPVIGHGKRSGALSTNVGSFQGRIGAVVLYNRKLTTTERSDLDAWLAANPSGGTAAAVPTVTAALSGSGALTAAAQPVEVRAASLTGSGTLAAAVVPVAVVAAAFAGSGSLSADVAPVETVAAVFSGSGELSAQVSTATTAQVAADFAGSGVLAADVAPVLTVDAPFNGAGALSASATVEYAVTASFTGSGSLTAAVATGGPLAEFVSLYDSTEMNGLGHLVETGLDPTMLFILPSIVLDPATTYTVTVDFINAVGDSRISLYSALGPTQVDADASQWFELANYSEGFGTPSGTLGETGPFEFTIGPGIADWAAAVTAGEPYVIFQLDNMEITSISVVDASAPLPPVFTSGSREGARSRGGYAVAVWEPPVVSAPGDEPLSERHVGAVAFSAVTLDGAQPVYATSAATKKRMRHRILVGGKDVSFYRGAPTPEPSYKLGEPLLWGDTSIDFPQIAAAFETPGELTAVSDLRWCAKGKPVVLQRVNAAGGIVAVDYRGVVVAYDVVNGKLRLEVGGHATGRAALRHKPRPIFRDTLDLGRLAWAAVRDLGLRFEPRLGPTTGIKQALWGGMGFAEYVTELCAKAWQRDGTQWTLMPSEAGVYRMQRKDRETVDFTVFTDDKRNVANLRSDAAEEPNRVFASGVTPRGQRVRFGVYPGLKPSRPAPYPFTDGRAFGFGTTDADTDTGDGITIMVRTLWAMGYLSLEDADPDGGFDADVRLAVDALQNDAGIHDGPLGYLDRGAMDTETWAALFDFDVTGFNLRGSRIEPAAQAPSTKRYRRSASGRIMGKNPHYDRHTLVVDRAIDFGSGFTRHQMREWARAEVDRGEDNWIGTIDITTGGVLHGEVLPGTEIGGDDVMDVRAIKPGMNAWLPTFAGGILVHVSGVDISYNGNGIPTAKLYVDTQARDRLAVWEIIRRNRESRRDPGRGWRGNRASGEIKDSVTEWDEVGGVLYDDAPLQPGWNVIPIVAGQEGEVSRIRLVVQDVTGGDGSVVITGREFACAVFGRKVSPKRLRTLIGNPLAASPAATTEPDPDDVDPPEADPEAGGADPASTVTAARPWWERKDIADELRALDILHSAGTREEPCGYSPGRKENGGTKTGLYLRDANFSYRTRSQPVLYLAVWVWGERTLTGGRVMWNQLEAGA